MRIIILFVSLSLLWPHCSHAEDLMAVYHQALARDPQLAAAHVARDVDKELVLQAEANRLPLINAGVDLNFYQQRIDYANQNVLGDRSATKNFSDRSISVNITQPLYHRDTPRLIAQANIRVKQTEAEYQATFQALMLKVAERYFAILAALDSLETARAEKRALERQLEQSKQRFTVGMVAITDVHETRASYDLAVARELAAANDVSNAQEGLLEVTGDYPGAVATLIDNTPLVPPEPTSPDHWAELAVTDNPTLEVTRLRVALAQKQIEIYGAGHYPQLDAVGGIKMQSSDSGGASGIAATDSAIIGLRLSVPLYQGGMIDSRVRQARADYTRNLELLEQTRRATILAVRKAYLGVITGIAQVNALKQAVVSSQSAFQATEAGYQVGTRTIVDVLNSQRLLFAAKRDYSQIRYEYVLNILRLKQAAGQIDEADLQAVNSWLHNAASLPSSNK